MPVNTIPVFSENAQTVLCKRYLSQAGDAVHAGCDRCGKYHETPVEMLQRVSFGVEEFYEVMARLDFLPNSPTLFNAGLNNGGTFSACFKFDVEDNLLDPDGIMDTGFKAAAVQKWGGGVGFTFSKLRPKGSEINSTHGRACGPVSVMKDLLQGIATMITQGGKREGAQMGILHCDHPDVEEFITCKSENPELINTFNISVACTDDFMRKATTPRSDLPGSKNSREFQLLWQMARAAHKTGDPGCYFIDTAESGNPTPWMGELTGTNPCGEVPLLNNEPCNLGSINLKNFAYPSQKLDVTTFGDAPDSRYVDSMPKFDFGRLVTVTRVAVRFLDRILDENTFPHPAIDVVARQTRKLGLGVMGWADALAIMHIDYDSDEAVELGGQIMETIQQAAHEESRLMAQEQGRAPAFDLGFINTLLNEAGKDVMLEEAPERRNATLTCIAPTGTISILADVSSGIEPHFALENSRTMGDGTALQEMVNVMEGWIPKTAHQVPWLWHLKHQAIFQKHTDLAVSKTINMSNDVSAEEIHQVYVKAWEIGCKGVTIYRDHSQVRQVLETTNGHKPTPVALDVKQNGVGGYTISNSTRGNRPLPQDRLGKTHHFKLGDMDGYLTYGMYEDGTLGEIFITANRQGSTVDGLLDAIAMMTSFCLQHGVPLDYLVEKMRGRRFEPSGLTGIAPIHHATSIIDYIFRWLGTEFLTDDHMEETATGQACPDCGTLTVNAGNCDVCPSCGWDKCGA